MSGSNKHCEEKQWRRRTLRTESPCWSWWFYFQNMLRIRSFSTASAQAQPPIDLEKVTFLLGFSFVSALGFQFVLTSSSREMEVRQHLFTTETPNSLLQHSGWKIKLSKPFLIWPLTSLCIALYLLLLCSSSSSLWMVLDWYHLQDLCSYGHYV